MAEYATSCFACIAETMKQTASRMAVVLHRSTVSFQVVGTFLNRAVRRRVRQVLENRKGSDTSCGVAGWAETRIAQDIAIAPQSQNDDGILTTSHRKSQVFESCAEVAARPRYSQVAPAPGGR